MSSMCTAARHEPPVPEGLICRENRVPTTGRQANLFGFPLWRRGGQQEVCLTTVGLDPIFEVNRSFRDRGEFTSRGSAHRVHRSDCGRKKEGMVLFGSRFTRGFGVRAIIECPLCSSQHALCGDMHDNGERGESGGGQGWHGRSFRMAGSARHRAG